MAHERQGKPTHKTDEEPRFTDVGRTFFVTVFFVTFPLRVYRTGLNGSRIAIYTVATHKTVEKARKASGLNPVSINTST